MKTNTKFSHLLSSIEALYGRDVYESRSDGIKAALANAYYNCQSATAQLEIMSDCAFYDEFSSQIMTCSNLEKMSLMDRLQESIRHSLSVTIEEIHDCSFDYKEDISCWN